MVRNVPSPSSSRTAVDTIPISCWNYAIELWIAVYVTAVKIAFVTNEENMLVISTSAFITKVMVVLCLKLELFLFH